MRLPNLLPAFLLLAIFAACVGCDGSASLYPVTGTVTYQDKPVEGATVQFIPTEGIAAIGTTDASGKFSLATAAKPGAAAGDYKVTVTKVTGGAATASPTPEDMKKMATSGGMKRTSELPEVYGTTQSTTLKATVKPETNDIPLDLK